MIFKFCWNSTSITNETNLLTCRLAGALCESFSMKAANYSRDIIFDSCQPSRLFSSTIIKLSLIENAINSKFKKKKKNFLCKLDRLFKFRKFQKLQFQLLSSQISIIRASKISKTYLSWKEGDHKISSVSLIDSKFQKELSLKLSLKKKKKERKRRNQVNYEYFIVTILVDYHNQPFIIFIDTRAREPSSFRRM